MKAAPFLIRLILICCTSLVIIGCAQGGGTSGSGVVVKGLVETTSGQPFQQALIELLETGESTQSDASGGFSLKTTMFLEQFTLHVTKDALNASVTIDTIPEEADAVSVRIVVDTQANTATATRIDFSDVQDFDLAAGVVGACDRFFENRGDRIRQGNPVKAGTSCLLKATVMGDGELQGGILVGIEHRACASGSPWRQVATAYTETGPHHGVAQIPFRFYDDVNSCFYRISAPYHDSMGRQSYVFIDTSTGQDSRY